jgi:hypothetical protein
VPGRGEAGIVIVGGGWGLAAGTGSALIPGEGLGASAVAGGMGCRGPERIWPGLGGGGAGRDGITAPRVVGAAGAVDCPVASGGRKGDAGRTGGGASGLSVREAPGLFAISDSGEAGSTFATGALSAMEVSGWRACS